MSSNSFRSEQVLLAALSQVSIFETDFFNLGEKLDSLDRLEVISACESELETELTEVLINPECWISFSTLSNAIISKVSDENE
jgi:hypothetical protein